MKGNKQKSTFEATEKENTINLPENYGEIPRLSRNADILLKIAPPAVENRISREKLGIRSA